MAAAAQAAAASSGLQFSPLSSTSIPKSHPFPAIKIKSFAAALSGLRFSPLSNTSIPKSHPFPAMKIKSFAAACSGLRFSPLPMTSIPKSHLFPAIKMKPFSLRLRSTSPNSPQLPTTNPNCNQFPTTNPNFSIQHIGDNNYNYYGGGGFGKGGGGNGGDDSNSRSGGGGGGLNLFAAVIVGWAVHVAMTKAEKEAKKKMGLLKTVVNAATKMFRSSKSKPKAKRKKTKEEKTFRRRAKYFLATLLVAVLVPWSLFGGDENAEEGDEDGLDNDD